MDSSFQIESFQLGAREMKNEYEIFFQKICQRPFLGFTAFSRKSWKTR